MNVVDANVLLYAVNSSSPQHDQARSWLDDSLNGSAAVGFSWSVLLAFVRLSTRAGVFPTPFSTEEALHVVRSWLDRPNAVVLEPTARHLTVLEDLLVAAGTAGNLTSDAHLAALAIEHRATVVSYDNDFSRLPGVRWRSPSA